MDQRQEAVNLTEEDGALLRLVRDAEYISRAELGRRTGLSRSVISARLEVLAGAGLVEDLGKGASTGGRPPSMVRFVPEAGYIAAIDLGATSADVAITDLTAHPVAHVATGLDVRDGPEKILGLVCEMVDGLLDDVPSSDRLRGVGIGLPGPVEFSTGLPVSPPIMPGWDQFPVRPYLAERYGIPVFVDNDVNLMALGEGCAGVGVGVPNFLYVKLGSGIGCGVICGGSVYRGRNGAAGDIGHITVSGRSEPCHCGNTGCLESVAGGRAMARAAEALAEGSGSPGLARRLASSGALTAADLAAAVRQGDLDALELVRSSGTAIGEVLSGVVNFYNPSLIIIGGGVAGIGNLLLATIRETVYRRSLPLATKDLLVTGGDLGGRAGIIGAAATVLGELFHLLPMAEVG